MILEVVDNTDNEFDTADIMDGDNIDKNSIGELFMFEVADKIDGDFDTAESNDNFGSWYFMFVFARWSSLSNLSHTSTVTLIQQTTTMAMTPKKSPSKIEMTLLMG